MHVFTSLVVRRKKENKKRLDGVEVDTYIMTNSFISQEGNFLFLPQHLNG